MKKEVEVPFRLSASYWEQDYGTNHTISTEFQSVPLGRRAVVIEGSLSVRGMDLKPGAKIKAVFTIEDDTALEEGQ